MNDDTYKVWTSTVTEENGELVVTLPPELIAHAGWQENDTWVWVIENDTCYIRKLQLPEG